MPSRGGQPLAYENGAVWFMFQFVPSRGGQHIAGDVLQPAAGFNSCPHAEGNGAPGAYRLDFQVSIRALTRRATVNRRICKAPLVVSIRALTRRATAASGGNCKWQLSFNSCPHAEGNLASRWFFLIATSFNSCPHAEGNQIILYLISSQVVSIRALTRRATWSSCIWRKPQMVSIRALTRRATLRRNGKRGKD